MFDTDTASPFRYCERKAASSLEPALGVGQILGLLRAGETQPVGAGLRIVAARLR